MKQTYASGTQLMLESEPISGDSQWAAHFAVFFGDWFAKVPQLHGSAATGFPE